MARRMDRYNNSVDLNYEEYSRSSKNQELYRDIGSNHKYTNLTDVSKVNAVYLDDAKKNSRTREGYKTIKEYGSTTEKPKVKKELDELNYLYQDHENRVYDINSAIKKAKEERGTLDEKEKRRKLKNTNYNILSSLNPEEIENYKKDKVERNKPDEDELRELIDTITSKTLAGEISRKTSVDLLSDLMATNVMDKVSPSSNDEKIEELEEPKKKKSDILNKKEIEKLEKAEKEYKEPTSELMKDMDKSFYTKSMDLSDKDFDFEEEEIKKVPTIVKVLLILTIIALLAIGAFFIVKNL